MSKRILQMIAVLCMANSLPVFAEYKGPSAFLKCEFEDKILFPKSNFKIAFRMKDHENPVEEREMRGRLRKQILEECWKQNGGHYDTYRPENTTTGSINNAQWLNFFMNLQIGLSCRSRHATRKWARNLGIAGDYKNTCTIGLQQ